MPRSRSRFRLLPLVLVGVFAVADSRAGVRTLAVKEAPFPFAVAEWTPPARDFPITAYGAKPGESPVTAAIDAAVEAAAQAGGGRVVLPPGVWRSGAFRLKSGVALVVEAGAVLHFPDDPVVVMRAPLRPDGRPTMTHKALIEAQGCTNVAVMGGGTIRSDVAYWQENFLRNPQKGFPRPQVMHFENCRNVRVEGVQVRGSPAWTMHFLLCEDIVLRSVDSICTGPNTDGLDLESCNRALVEDCSLDQTDDTYTIKSGFNEAGRRRNVPTQNVVIRRCRAVNGHTLLAIGSEVSGGVRNIWMSDCTVESACWKFLNVKTNPKRGAFVENVYLEDVRGVAAETAVFSVEMFYDGNPVKELTKKAERTWPTAISNIVLRRVTCAEAGVAVKVRGDPERPPKALSVQDVRVGRVRDRLVVAENAPELAVADVRIDPSAIREIYDVPPQVRAYDPVRDEAVDGPSFAQDALEALSANAVCRRVLDARIKAEVKEGRNVALRVLPLSEPDKAFYWMYSPQLARILAELGCAVPGAWMADDVRQVALNGHDGVSLRLTPDVTAGTVTVSLVNAGATSLSDVWCVVHLAPEHLSRRRTFRVARVAPGETLVRTFPFGAGAHYLPRPVGPSPYAASADFTQGGVRRRLWAVAAAPDATRAPNLVRAVRHVGPVDVLEMEDETLVRLSAEDGALPPLGTNAWQSVAFPGAAWYNAAPKPRPYTTHERALVRAARAWSAAAVQFDVPSNSAPTRLRCTAPKWSDRAVAFLNGVRIPLVSATQELPVRIGCNRLIVKYPARSGDRTTLLQMTVYNSTWDCSTCWPCVPFPPAAAPVPPVAAVRPGNPLVFPLEWNGRRDVSVPYEVEVSTNKLATRVGLKPNAGLVVRALSADGARDLKTTLLPGRTEGCVFLRFAVPAGTTGLVCRAQGRAAVADPERTDNLLAGALSTSDGWKATPRLKVTQVADGELAFDVLAAGDPEATRDVPVPTALRGQPVRFEAGVANASDWSCRMNLRVLQLDADGRRLPESVVDRRWTGLMLPARWRGRFVECGLLHPAAATVRVSLSVGGKNRPYDRYGLPVLRPEATMPSVRLSALVLRPAATLPFPKYDDANFAPGVSGAADDGAIRLGGSEARTFWYQTRSSASWSDGAQLRDERQVFFPSGAGTVEAWFRSDWKPTPDAAGDGTRNCPIVLFQSYQSYHRYYNAGKGVMLQLAYRPQPGRLELALQDRFGTKYDGGVAARLPAGTWCHLAVQWAPGGVAEVFVDGCRALALPIPKWRAVDLGDRTIENPNDAGGLEFYLGSSWRSARGAAKVDPARPLFEGEADALRISTGCRYVGDFAPARTFGVDGDTRALFSFDRTFDGVSGGGVGRIPGTTQAWGAGRVARDMRVGGRAVPYWPKGVLPENDPAVVLETDNYPDLPTPTDFEALRRPFRKTAQLRPGESFDFDCPESVTTDFVEIANESDRPLAYPVVLNAGDVDPRSFGDLADTLGLEGLSGRAKANRVFGFVLSSMDYFMNHTAMFRPGSDEPSNVEYQSMLMFNGYCGFECGPLNNLAANLFVEVAGLPAAQTGGYAHSFQQVFYGGKNHIYDVSVRKFFPAADNETAAGLGEADDECGIFPRLGVRAEYFVRKSTRGHGVQSPGCFPKIGVTLNPGESFRVWQVNAGNGNDLITKAKTGPYRGSASRWRPDAAALCHAGTEKMFLQRTERFFPHALSGFIRYDGVPSAGNPAFGEIAEDSFCYRVSGGGYPIVQAAYAATRRDGTSVALEISTDGGRTFRPLESPADYAVRARSAYLVRVKAPIRDIANFSASTEVLLNPRIYPGRLKPGRNRLTLRATAGAGARVTVQGRVPAGRLAIPAAVSSGAVRGAETLFFAFDPATNPVLEVQGVSSRATVRTTDGLRATLADGHMTLSADPPPEGARFAFATISDGGAEKTLTVLFGAGVRFALARNATCTGGARWLGPDATSPQARGRLMPARHNAEVAFRFDPLPAGRYAVLNLNRFRNADGPLGEQPFHDTNCLRMLWPGLKSTDAGSVCNLGCSFKRARFGRPGEPANFKWDYPWQEGTSYPYTPIRVASYPAGDGVRFRSWSNSETVEVVAVLVVPDPSRDLRCTLTKILCGLNCDPARIGNIQTSEMSLDRSLGERRP